jgi:hypothetical protein
MQPHRESVAVVLARWKAFLREWAEAVEDELSKMDNAAELRCASTYQSLAPQMGALSAK